MFNSYRSIAIHGQGDHKSKPVVGPLKHIYTIFVNVCKITKYMFGKGQGHRYKKNRKIVQTLFVYTYLQLIIHFSHIKMNTFLFYVSY